MCCGHVVMKPTRRTTFKMKVKKEPINRSQEHSKWEGVKIFNHEIPSWMFTTRCKPVTTIKNRMSDALDSGVCFVIWTVLWLPGSDLHPENNPSLSASLASSISISSVWLLRRMLTSNTSSRTTLPIIPCAPHFQVHLELTHYSPVNCSASSPVSTQPVILVHIHSSLCPDSPVGLSPSLLPTPAVLSPGFLVSLPTISHDYHLIR